MEKNREVCLLFRRRLEQIEKKMKLTFLFSFLLAFAGMATNSYSQVTKLSMNLRNVRVQDVLKQIEQQTDYYFMYKDELFKPGQRVTIQSDDEPLDVILEQLAGQTLISYEISDRQIILKEGTAPAVTGVVQQPTRPVNGMVTSRKGEPLTGVTVVVKNTSIGTVTDVDGKFQLNVPADAQTLVFSFIGMVTQEVAVAGKSTFTVILDEATIGVDEVVVTALGIERNKKTLTYATQLINVEGLSTVRDVSLGNALAGKVAGVSVTASTGTTGVSGDPRIIIRGDRSINGNNQPLIVVDGIPYSSTGGGLSSINPDDVQSMNVLKGPAASALYGSSANNGVIVITTRKGRSGEASVEVNSVTTFDLPYLYPDIQNEYAQGLNGVFLPNTDVYSWGPKMTGQKVVDWTGKETKLEPQPNNIKDFFRIGHNLTNSFSYSAGNEKSTTYFSYSNTTAQGVLEDNKMQRHNVNLRLTAELIKNLSLDFKTTWFRQFIKDKPTTGDDLFSPMHQLIRMPRSLRTSDVSDYFYYTEAGDYKQRVWIPGSTNVINPYWSMYGYENPSTTNRVNSLATIKYRFTNYLYLQLRGGMTISNSDSEIKRYWDTQYVNSGKGGYETSFSKSQVMNGDVLLVFDKDITKDFHLNISGGAEIRDSQGRSINSATGELSAENKFALNYGVTLVTTDAESRIQKQSVYGMAQLGFRNYLFLDATARNDWSSTLPAPYDYFYPSIGLTAILSDMVDLPEPFSFVKLRGSYAEVGNDAGFAQIFQTFSRASNGPAGMVYPAGTKVPVNLIPEKTKSWEAGGEIHFLNSRLGIDFTYYKSNTYNQLITITSPPTSGFGSGRINTGNIENRGLEFMIFAYPVKTKDFTWNIDLNFASNKNKVIELSKKLDKYQISSPNLSIGETWAMVDRPFGEIFTKGFVRNEAGQVIVDALGMPKVDSKANLYLGNFNYDWRSGITNTLNYKNWNLSFLIDLNVGGVRQSATEAMMFACGTSTESLVGRETGIVFDGVQEITDAQGNKTYVPNTVNITAQAYAQLVGGRISFGAGEPYNRKADNSRLRELSFGYSVPLKSKTIKSLRINAVGRNLFYIYNGCKWFDPDVTYDIDRNGQGAESAFLPGSRTLGFNIRVTL